MTGATVICKNCGGGGASPSVWVARCVVCRGEGVLPGLSEVRALRLALYAVLYGGSTTTTATEGS